MCLSETGTLPAPLTEDELDRQRLLRLKNAMKAVSAHYNEPHKLGAKLVTMGFRLNLDSWGDIQVARDTIISIGYQRIGAICSYESGKTFMAKKENV